MTQELILHIGANKTGSSAIQHFLRRNVEPLRELGFHVPDGNLGWTPAISGAQVFFLQSLFRSPDPLQQVTAAFDGLMSGRPDGTVLVSAENLSNNWNAMFFKEVCAKYRTRVILYIRRQDELLSSSWQQWLSKKHTDMTAWLINGLRLTGHWEAIINNWESVAGPDSVVVRIFERENFPNGNIVADFLDALGISQNDAKFDFSSDDVNPTFSEIITPLVAGNPQIFQDVHDNLFYNFVKEYTGEYYSKGKKYSLLTRDQRNSIISYYESENERIRAKYFPERQRLFRHVEHARYIYPAPDEVVHEQLRFLTHMVFELAKRVRG